MRGHLANKRLVSEFEKEMLPKSISELTLLLVKNPKLQQNPAMKAKVLSQAMPKVFSKLL
jgi:hypothetical protein